MAQWQGIQSKYLKISPYGLGAIGLIALAVAIRFALIARGWPLLDSDEGTMGIMAMHILNRGELPLFFYGQGYMGATEAYLAAIMFHFFGVSAFTLRIGLILIFTVFLSAMYLLTGLLYSKKWALVTLALLAVGSNPILLRELVAVGGDPETLMCGALIMLLTSWLALTSRPDASTRNQWRRVVAYTCWGLTAGFALFSHMLGLPFIVSGAVILLLFCWRELASWAPVCLLLGLLIGISPIIVYNLTAPPGKDTLFYVFHALSAGKTPIQILPQIKGAFLISLPLATGAAPTCATVDVHALRLDSLHSIHCTLVHTGWSLGVVTLWVCASLMALKALWQRRFLASQRTWSFEERQTCIRNVIQLSLLVSSAGTLLLYAYSPNSALYPVATSRYLIGFLITTPVLLWPLWEGAHILKPLVLKFFSRVTLAVRLERISVMLGRGILVLIGLVFLLGTFSTFTNTPASPPKEQGEDVYYTQVNTHMLNVPEAQTLNQQESVLIHALIASGATHIYSDYWTCDRLIFQSQERIICKAINDDLGSGHDRYLAYSSIVQSDPYAAYVVHADSWTDHFVMQRIANHDPALAGYQRQVVAGYAVYLKGPWRNL